MRIAGGERAAEFAASGGRVGVSETAAPVIMDVGMHVGQDTRYYLAKGFRVVGIEARPDLVAANRRRFAADIALGQLSIVHCAVAASAGTARFWVFSGKDEWGTLDERYVRRNLERGYAHEVVEVPSRPFEDIVREHGMPYYVKIDIEGADLLCLRALLHFAERPRFISLELTLLDFDAAFEALARLYALGYRRFKIVDQALNPLRRSPRPAREGRFAEAEFDMGASGPFGEETPGPWQNAAAIVQRMHRLVKHERLFAPEGRWSRLGWIYNGLSRWPHQYGELRKWRAALTTASWYDLHAAV